MNQPVIKKIDSVDDLRVLANEIAADSGSRLILLLHGPMGVGKTQFTKYLLEAVGSDETVSPSFAIYNSYTTARGDIQHFDLFRLSSGDDLESTGFWDVFEDNETWVIIEWSERLQEFGLAAGLPRSWPKLTLELSFDPENPNA